ncbi:MAG: hypothetical protein KKC46_21760 [Proteobacteria bacterium]|nr:hypothetical protein [Pseudomonadota bacterium]
MNIILAVIGLVISIAGLLITIFTISQRRKKSWRQILREIDLLKGKLAGKFNYIISFADGGLIAADLLHIKGDSQIPVLSLNLKIMRNNKGSKLVKVLTGKDSLLFLKNKKILLIDDVVQTGRNMEAVVIYLTDEVGIDRENIITAVLGKPKGITGFVVDYYGFEYSTNTIELPWGIVPRHS